MVLLKKSITAIENLEFEIYFSFSQFKHIEFFTSYGDSFLNTKL